MNDLELSELWTGLDDNSAETDSRRDEVLSELWREIGQGHELEGRLSRVMAIFEASDDVIVQLIDGTYALVHRTWSRNVERPPWPSTTRVGRGQEASRAIAQWEALW